MYKCIVWCRKREPGAQWFDMPYAPRYRDEAEALIDYYVGEGWGKYYEYEVHAQGFYPSSTRDACFIGHM